MVNMSIFKYIIVAVVAYLLGSLNFSIIISKLTLKKDVRDYGSGNAGTTNSLRVMGMKKTLLVILGDILKGVIAVIVANLIFGESSDALVRSLAGLFCILGHTFPVFFGFRGGKGVLTTAAVVGCCDIRVCLLAVSLFIIIVAVTRFVSLGSIIAIWSVPLLFAAFAGFTQAGITYICFGVLVAVFVTILHRSNIKRLLAGNENKLKFKK